MTKHSPHSGSPSTVEICTALRVLGVKIPDDGDGTNGMSRAEALGRLLMHAEGALIVESDPIALEEARLGYLGSLVAQAKSYGYASGELDAPLQEMTVRSLQLRLRRAAYDWANMMQTAPADFHEQPTASAFESLVLAAAELLDPFYPRLKEPGSKYAERFRDAFRAAGPRIVAARRSIENHRALLKARGFKV